MPTLMDKRFQVFVSSTFTDLIDERRAVMQALLELNCIPAGMELFPASTEEQWTVIKSVIDDCDYYLVIVAGRYGSMDAAGISYTEKEYDYAVQQGKPVLGFVHKDPGSIPAKFSDGDSETAAKLAAFRVKVQTRLCKPWSTADELGGVVSRSYVQLLKTHPAEGWVKGRYVKSTEDLEKVNQMYEQIRTLEAEITHLREHDRGGGTSMLAQGDDPVTLTYQWTENKTEHQDEVTVTWNALFAVVGRLCMDMSAEKYIRRQLQEWLAERLAIPPQTIRFDATRVKIQFFSLGLIKTEVVTRGSIALSQIVVVHDRCRRFYHGADLDASHTIVGPKVSLLPATRSIQIYLFSHLLVLFQRFRYIGIR